MTDYVATAAGAGAPGVVVAHDWFGLLPHMQQQCDALASAGFTAVAVDLYDGAVAHDPVEAESLMESLSAAGTREKLAAAVRRLRSGDVNAPRVGGLGFSMGGWLVLRAATAGLFDAVSVYYAVLEPPETAPLPCPVQLHLAAVDEWELPDSPERFAQACRDAGVEVDMRSYPATEHSFANPAAAQFAPAAADRAWGATIEFLSRVLNPRLLDP